MLLELQNMRYRKRSLLTITKTASAKKYKNMYKTLCEHIFNICVNQTLKLRETNSAENMHKHRQTFKTEPKMIPKCEFVLEVAPDGASLVARSVFFKSNMTTRRSQSVAKDGTFAQRLSRRAPRIQQILPKVFKWSIARDVGLLWGGAGSHYLHPTSELVSELEPE